MDEPASWVEPAAARGTADIGRDLTNPSPWSGSRQSSTGVALVWHRFPNWQPALQIRLRIVDISPGAGSCRWHEPCTLLLQEAGHDTEPGRDDAYSRYETRDDSHAVSHSGPGIRRQPRCRHGNRRNHRAARVTAPVGVAATRWRPAVTDTGGRAKEPPVTPRRPLRPLPSSPAGSPVRRITTCPDNMRASFGTIDPDWRHLNGEEDQVQEVENQGFAGE